MRAAAAIAAVLSVAAPHPHRHKFFGGVIPDGVRATLRAQVANLPYGGGPVLHSNRTHLIFWQPAGSGLGFDPGYESLIETFLEDVAADSHQPTNVYALTGQYRDRYGPAAYESSYGGAVVASDPLPASGCIEPLGPPLGPGPGWFRCLTDQQLQAEVGHVASSDHLPLTANDIYFLLTPDGLGSCEFSGPQHCALGGDAMAGYCGYHSVTPPGVPYAVIPYNAISGHCQSGSPRPNGSSADPAISTLSHEHNEVITDPYGDAWIDTSFREDGDLCLSNSGPVLGGAGMGAFNEVIGGHHYYLQEEWSNDDDACQPRDEADEVSFIVPRRLRAGRTASFTASAIDPDGQIVAYGWSFGDGRAGAGRRASHTFRRPGRYTVSLRATDSAGNWGIYTKTVGVARPARG